jgi:hypothetical protein
MGMNKITQRGIELDIFYRNFKQLLFPEILKVKCAIFQCNRIYIYIDFNIR